MFFDNEFDTARYVARCQEYVRRSSPQQLYEQLLSYHYMSAAQLDGVGCIRIECTRSYSATRIAHFGVLHSASKFFADELVRQRIATPADLPESIFRPITADSIPHKYRRPLRLDVTAEIMDVILEYVYTAKLDADRVRPDLFQLRSACQRFGLSGMARLLEPGTADSGAMADDHGTFASAGGRPAGGNFYSVNMFRKPFNRVEDRRCRIRASEYVVWATDVPDVNDQIYDVAHRKRRLGRVLI